MLTGIILNIKLVKNVSHPYYKEYKNLYEYILFGMTKLATIHFSGVMHCVKFLFNSQSSKDSRGISRVCNRPEYKWMEHWGFSL